jgi:hypothetical protein
MTLRRTSVTLVHQFFNAQVCQTTSFVSSAVKFSWPGCYCCCERESGSD